METRLTVSKGQCDLTKIWKKITLLVLGIKMMAYQVRLLLKKNFTEPRVWLGFLIDKKGKIQ